LSSPAGTPESGDRSVCEIETETETGNAIVSMYNDTHSMSSEKDLFPGCFASF